MFNATNQTILPGQTLPNNTVYQCTTVVQAVQETNGSNFAVFRLDRAVDSAVATPAVVATNEMTVGTQLVMIGQPIRA